MKTCYSTVETQKALHKGQKENIDDMEFRENLKKGPKREGIQK